MYPGEARVGRERAEVHKSKYEMRKKGNEWMVCTGGSDVDSFA